MGAVQNYVSVSRRPPDIEDYIDIMRRYRSWIIGPMFAGLVTSVVVAFLWPDTYMSTADMRITPQQVSQRLVPAEVTSQMGERLNQMQQEILSRSSLSGIITQPSLDLYKKDRQQRPMEDIVQDMRKYIKIQMMDMPGGPGGDRKMASAFSISFQYTDRYKAQAVVRELVTKFTEQNVRVLRNQAQQTSTFLEDELKTAKEHVDEISARITKFKMENAGRLPEQASANVTALNSLQMQIGQTNESLNRAQANKQQLETTLNNLQSEVAYYSTRAEDVQLLPGQSPTSVKNERIAELDRNLIKFKADLASMRKQYKDSYPLVGALQAQIDTLQGQKDEALKEEAAQQMTQAATATGPTQIRVANPMVQQRLQDLRNSINATKTMITNTDVEIQTRQRQIAELNRKIGEYQSRIDASPLNEQQYAQLMGDYNLAKQEYDDQVKKREQSATAQNLEEHKAGENLEVLDPASLPEQSFEPNRPAWIGIGTAMGLMLGIVMAAAKEVKNTSLKNLKDVRAYTNLPVLSSIPLLENALLVRRKRRLFWLVWSSAFIFGSIAMTGAMYYHFFCKS
jgi:polysaccharide chain length determinant protein (PEP-CTERM system associated)